jgi:hypothetical protein
MSLNEKKEFFEILRLVEQFDFQLCEDEIFIHVNYNNESKNIKNLKYLVEKSRRLQW